MIVLEENRYDLASLSASVSSAIDAVDSYNSWSVERPQRFNCSHVRLLAMDNIQYILTYLSMVEAHQICTSSDCIRTGLDLSKQLYTDSKHHQ